MNREEGIMTHIVQLVAACLKVQVVGTGSMIAESFLDTTLPARLPEFEAQFGRAEDTAHP